jgi:hypothetical protein
LRYHPRDGPRSPRAVVAIVLGASATLADSPHRRGHDKVAAINLRTSCRLTDEESIYACRLAVASALDIHRLMVSNHPQLAIYCPRQEPTIEEARHLFLAWMERAESRSASMYVSGGVGVLMALRESWPCFR